MVVIGNDKFLGEIPRYFSFENTFSSSAYQSKRILQGCGVDEIISQGACKFNDLSDLKSS